MTQKMDILVNEELLKDKLSNYREICPVLLDVFIWRKEVYPLVLSGVVSLIFGFLWYSDATVITTFALFGLALTLADFLGPLIYSHSIKSSESNWSSEKEKKFCILTNRICYFSVIIWNASVTLDEWRKERPNAYSVCVVISLLLLAWIGNAVNNLLIAYIVVLFLVLLPGLLHRRIPQMYFSRLVLLITGALGIKGKKT